MGLGRLHDRGGITEDALLEGAETGDHLYVDYGHGRMMKLSIQWSEDAVHVRDGAPRIDYQSWCLQYPTYEALVGAAVESLKMESAATRN